jgi:uncharacterized membrane protein
MHRYIRRVIEHKVFHTGLYIKAIYGFLESIAGIIVLFASQRMITRFVQFIFGQEFIEDPHDLFGSFFLNLANNLSVRMHVFIGLYILVHGLVNIALVLALIHKKRWAFPAAGALMGIFVIYQIYTICFTFSLLMIFLTITDLIILALLKFEYDYQYKKKK